MDNAGLTAIPSMEELKAVVFSMSPSSAPGPDGLFGKFYHSCWDIIKDDLLLMINDFFAGFIKGSSITENIMMTQNMVHNITKPSTNGNVVLKVDMPKAYDRVPWEYLYSNGPVISHLCYADDTILFSSAEPESLKIMMEKMETYEKTSGQLVNKAKSGFYVNFQDDDIRINRIKQITGYNHCHFSVQYLGCPIYIGRKKAIPLHTLSVLHPPKATFSQIKKIISNFFWGMDDNKNKKHWMVWKDMCFPIEEGGAGFRSLKDTCNAFSAKIWWKFRTKKSLIKDFLEAKYCKRFHPVAIRKAQCQSQFWRRMMDIKEKVEPYISWSLVRGEISF
ncbi:uncharacterized protein LOC142175183 [Nicotiana tabacum]|uniref:Uncharacterized protein LOC142175183 n=1 Tax=Nicotiana tabacum TaxID=4097 RepID=A0AC58TKV8_TOBAC